MPQLYFARQHEYVHTLVGSDPAAIDTFCRYNGVPPAAPLLYNMPYCLDDDHVARSAMHLLRTRPMRERQRLACCAEQFGELTLGLAEFYDAHLAFFDLQNNASLVGGGATVRGTYNDRFIKALRHYQDALIELNRFERGGQGNGAERQRLRHNATQRYQTLNQAFQRELQRFVRPGAIGKNRGNALTSAERGLTLASRARGRGIHIANMPQAQKLLTLGRALSHVGNNMIVVDAGIRLAGVHQQYRDKENWARAASIQATGFGAGGAAGLAAGKAMVSMLAGIGLASTPAGWLILMGIGMGAGFGFGYAFDAIGRSFAAGIWDR